jgi:hypothetical protein
MKEQTTQHAVNGQSLACRDPQTAAVMLVILAKPATSVHRGCVSGDMTRWKRHYAST